MARSVRLLDRGVAFGNEYNRIFSYNGWPTLGMLDDGTLVLVASGFRNWHVDPFGKVIMVMSRDEGKTWSQPTVVIDTLLDDRDAGFLNLGGGKLMVSSFSGGIASLRDHLRRYPEYLAAFNPLITGYADMVSAEEERASFKAYYRLSGDSGFTWGPVHPVDLSTPHGPVLLGNGDVLFVGNKMPANPDGERILVYKSTDRAEHFAPFSHIPMPRFDMEGIEFAEPHAVCLNSGKLICHIRADYLPTPSNTALLGEYNQLFQSVSYDGGAHWSTAEKLPLDGHPAHLMQHSGGTVISTYGHRADPCSIMAAFSDDEGETWTYDVVIDDFPENWDMGYPSTVELANGDLMTAYYAKDSHSTASPLRYARWHME